MSRKLTSLLLATLMVLTLFTMAFMHVSADTDSLPPVKEGCNRYFFNVPDIWYNDYTQSVGIYWDGDDISVCPASWPGYKAIEADVEGIYYYDVPKDVTTIVWNNYLDGGNDIYDDRFRAAVQTVKISTIHEVECNLPNFSNMIYVLDYAYTEVNNYDGKILCSGFWFYYYGDGEYGNTPVYGDGMVYTRKAFNDEPFVCDMLMGDSNCDSKVSIQDATAIQLYLADIDVVRFNHESADVDGDKEVTIKDATAIQKYLADLPSPEIIDKYIYYPR